ncbi:hypothetical protein SCARD494_06706 [Seiridium cardinale]
MRKNPERADSPNVPGRSKTRSAVPMSNWLPSQHPPIIPTKALHLNFINANKHHDWFLRLAWAMNEDKGDELQCRMLAKVYIFLREFMPQGLTGEFAHLQGDQIMHHLLCHKGEHQMSRHKMAKEADAAFAELQKWMAGNDWTDYIRQPHVGRNTWKAPALHSPEGIVALMVIAHPVSSRFRDWINRLGLQWMMKPRNGTWCIDDGYWNGMDPSNLYIFQPPEPRTAEIPLLVDYTRLLGRGFLCHRKDIRPCLQPWAAHIQLDGDPSDCDVNDLDADGSETGDGHPDERTQIPPSLVLRKYLFSSGETEIPTALEVWLHGKLATALGGKILPHWCEQWAKRVEEARHHEQQLIVRSLFLQSLRRLQGLWQGLPEPMVAAYTLVDIGDWELKTTIPGGKAILHELEKKAGPFAACIATNVHLSSLFTAQPVRDFMETIAIQQLTYHKELLGHKTLCKYAKDVMSFDNLRTQVLIYSLQVSDDREVVHQGGLLSPDIILNENTVTTLNLTNWQRRALLVGFSSLTVLTDVQLRIFGHKICPGPNNSIDQPDLSITMPITPVNTELSVDGELIKIREQHDVFRKLFGIIQHPFVDMSLENASKEARSSPTSISSISSAQFSPSTKGFALQGISTPATATPNTEGQSRVGLCRGRSPTPPPWPNPFAGKKHPLVNSGFSPAQDGREPKKRKLGILTQEALAEELKVERELLVKELRDQNERLKLELIDTSRHNSAVAVSDVKSKLSALEASFEEVKSAQSMALTAASLRAIVKDEIAMVELGLNKRISDVEDGVKNQLMTMDGTREEIKSLQTVTGTLRTTQKDILEVLQRLEGSLAKPPPLPGQSGYLALHCVVPAGTLPFTYGLYSLIDLLIQEWWDQRSYEAMLLRAAWYYIHALGDPDDGVGPDEDALETTRLAFPDISPGHFLIALGHVHLQAYNRPFGNQAEPS